MLKSKIKFLFCSVLSTIFFNLCFFSAVIALSDSCECKILLSNCARVLFGRAL